MNDSTSRPVTVDDPRVIERVERYQYLATVDRPAAREQILADFPHLAGDLNACLDGLELLASWPAEWTMPATLAGDEAETMPAAHRLGDFRIVRELGRGGMGVVYEAEQLSLRRRVALKVLPFAALLDPRRLRRFQQEAQAAAILRHDNIVSVHCVGSDRGVHFYAMELVEGQTVAQLISQLRHESESDGDAGAARTDADPLPLGDPPATSDAETSPVNHWSTAYSRTRPTYYRDVARLAAEVADALQFAHQQGIVHRDVKPSNLILDQQAKPWITDFGLAQVHNDQGMTMTGARENAERAKERAERAHRELQSLLTDTLTAATETLENTPGIDTVHEKLLDDTLERYKQLLSQPADADAALRFEVATAYNRLGRVMNLRFSQPKAIALFRSSIDVLETLMHDEPERNEYRVEMAWAYQLLGYNQWSAEPLRKSIELMEPLVAAHPDNIEYRFQLAGGRSFFGEVLLTHGDLPAAEELLVAAEQAAAEISGRFPENAQYRADWLYFKKALGGLNRERCRFEIAERQLRDVLDLSLTIREITQRQTRYQIAYAEALEQLGATLTSLRRPTEAEGYLRDGIGRLEAITQGFPDSQWAAMVLNGLRIRLAEALEAQGRLADAEAVVRQARSAREGQLLKDASPDQRCAACYQLARIVWRQDRREESGMLFREAVDLARAEHNHTLLANMYASCPDTSVRDAALSLHHARLDDRPGSGSYWRQLGVSQYANGDWAAARDALEKALPLLNGGEAFDFCYLAMAYHHLGERQEADRWWRQSRDGLGGPLTVSKEQLDEAFAAATEMLGQKTE